MTYESREEIPQQYRWDLASIFENDEAFLRALEDARNYPAAVASFQNKISKSPEDLLAYLKLDDEIGVALGKLVNYAQRKYDQDTRNATYQNYSARVMDLYTQIAGSGAWFAPELLKLDNATMEGFYTSCPELELYRRALDIIFRKREHVLGDAEELVLAKAQDMAMQPGNIYSLFNDADMQFDDAIDAQGKSHAVTHGSYVLFKTP